jgi:hypothetical protein
MTANTPSFIPICFNEAKPYSGMRADNFRAKTSAFQGKQLLTNAQYSALTGIPPEAGRQHPLYREKGQYREVVWKR